MFAAAFGYILILILTATLLAIVSFLLRMVLTLIVSRIYAGITGNTDPMGMIKSSIALVQPIGFLSSIFHGYISLWLGTVILKGLDVPVDWFLPLFLTIHFLMAGVRQMNAKTEVKVEGDPNVIQHSKDTTIILNPTEEDDNIQQDRMRQINEQMRHQLKNKTTEIFQGNAIVGAIGKITGVAIAALRNIPNLL